VLTIELWNDGDNPAVRFVIVHIELYRSILSIVSILISHLTMPRPLDGMTIRTLESKVNTRGRRQSIKAMVASRLLVPLKLSVIGYAKAFEKAGLEYYFFNCIKHGRVVSYPQGHNNFLACPECGK